jgi:hypothetical protein
VVPHVLVAVACEIGFETSKRRCELGPCHYEGLEIASGSRWCNDDLVGEGWRNQTDCGLSLVQIQIASMTLISRGCMNVPCSFGQGIERGIDLGQQPFVVFESEIEIEIESVSMTLTLRGCMNVPCSSGQGIERGIGLGQQPCVVFENENESESESEIVSKKSLCRMNNWRRNPSLNPLQLQLQEQVKRVWACSEDVFASLL